MRNVKKLWIAEVYPNSEMYADEANKTIGKPIIGANAAQLIMNRRSVSNKLTELGNKAMNEVIDFFQDFFDETRFKVTVKFDVHCGCAMCPCSPGFKVFVETIKEKEFIDLRGCGRLKEDARINVWFDDKNKIAHTWKPKNIYDMTWVSTKTVISWKEEHRNDGDRFLKPLFKFVEAGYDSIPEEKQKTQKVFLFKLK